MMSALMVSTDLIMGTEQQTYSQVAGLKNKVGEVTKAIDRASKWHHQQYKRGYQSPSYAIFHAGISLLQRRIVQCH